VGFDCFGSLLTADLGRILDVEKNEMAAGEYEEVRELLEEQQRKVGRAFDRFSF
jgi:hypothetical protein